MTCIIMGTNITHTERVYERCDRGSDGVKDENYLQSSSTAAAAAAAAVVLSLLTGTDRGNALTERPQSYYIIL